MTLAYTYTLSNGTTANATHVQTNFDDAKTYVNALLALESQVSVSSNVSLTNKALHLVSTAAARTLTLPAPSTTLALLVKDVTGSAATNTITINPNGAQTIDGQSSVVVDYNYGAVMIISDGSNYFVI